MQNNKNQSFYKSLISGSNRCRNTKEQKKQARESICRFVGPSTKIEEVPICRPTKFIGETGIIGYNLIIGYIKNAKYIIVVHYDTPSVPDSDYKYSSIRYIGWRRFLSRSMRWLTISFVFTLVSILIDLMKNNIIFHALIVLGLSSYLIFAYRYYNNCKPNPFNANDNSSGVCLALHLLQKYPDKVAVILFDCEEDGKKGSNFMKKDFKNDPLYAHKTFINLDTIGCNDIIRIAQDKCEDIDPKTGTRVILPKDDTFEGKQILIDKSYGDNTDFVNLPKGRRIGIETINGDPEKKCPYNLGTTHSAGDTTVNPEMMECVMHLVEEIINSKDQSE